MNKTLRVILFAGGVALLFVGVIAITDWMSEPYDQFLEQVENERPRSVEVFSEIEGVTYKTTVTVRGRITDERHKIITDAVNKAMNEYKSNNEVITEYYDITDIKLQNDLRDMRLPIMDISIIKDPTKITCDEIECNVVPDVDL